CALAVQRIFREENILENAQKRAVYLNSRLNERLGGYKHTGEIRHIGLINAIELVQAPETKTGFDSAARTGYQIYKKALDRGLLLRPLGDVLYFNPPLIITENDIDEAVDRCEKAIWDILGE
ncbi:MAG: aminotransferase class III-fold pyridoxal phosphate-dependent enzyme, partial [Oscillospiraceae bacterium]